MQSVRYALENMCVVSTLEGVLQHFFSEVLVHNVLTVEHGTIRLKLHVFVNLGPTSDKAYTKSICLNVQIEARRL